jgi:hypothetical protein
MKTPKAFDNPTVSISHAAAKTAAMTIKVKVSMPDFRAATARF